MSISSISIKTVCPNTDLHTKNFTNFLDDCDFLKKVHGFQPNPKADDLVKIAQKISFVRANISTSFKLLMNGHYPKGWMPQEDAKQYLTTVVTCSQKIAKEVFPKKSVVFLNKNLNGTIQNIAKELRPYSIEEVAHQMDVLFQQALGEIAEHYCDCSLIDSNFQMKYKNLTTGQIQNYTYAGKNWTRCVEYAFYTLNDQNAKPFIFHQNAGSLVDLPNQHEILTSWGYSRTNDFQTGKKLVCYFKNFHQPKIYKHYGVLENNQIKTKWGALGVFEEDASSPSLPSVYGSFFVVYDLPQTNQSSKAPAFELNN